ncbi:DNA replication/repair protein RecF [Kangiella japonica]|uniref:DNA replication and repair protein RecF n=1 Tax=Kangiella japonica TaxID=647384 RepID=A0ABN0T048_9GAMM
MRVNQLTITQVRNLQNPSLNFSPRLNIFFGPNAAGKSSILESLYILGNGRSFRTTKHNNVITENNHDFTLFAKVESSDINHQLGFNRQRNGDTTIKLNSEPVNRLSTLAKLCPVQILSPEQYDLLVKGPGARRKQLDWGVFHVEHSVLEVWQKTNKILQHRNKLLKQKSGYSDVSVWDNQLVSLSEQVTQLRQAYCDKINPLFSQLCQQFLGQLDIKINLFPGWTDKHSIGLSAIYREQFEKDKKLGFTQSSIQKADLKFLIDGTKSAGDYLSRGQQKLLITAFKLAQLKVMQAYGQQAPVFLLDDIGAELDERHQNQLLDLLASQPNNQQIFITCVHLEPLKPLISHCDDLKLFHVEHGVVKEVAKDEIEVYEA